MDERISMIDIFKEIIKNLASRSTCDRAHVGCIITRDERIVATGYNGSLPGDEHCGNDNHLLVDGHCVRTTHAEMNALMFCAKNGINVNDCEIWITHSPCPLCTKLLVMSGINKVNYIEAYRLDENPFRAKISMEEIK